MEYQAPTTLLTGATGFLGHHILRDLLLKGRRVIALLRSPLPSSAERLGAMLGKIGMDWTDTLRSGQLVLLEGALPDSLPDVGPVDDIVSCAASLQLLSNGNGEPFRTNVEGLEALLAWANRHQVQTFHAVSTAYVCGTNNGNVREVFHLEPPSFQTDYERSKWLAERKIAEWAGQEGRTLTVFRPSFLIGDSTTGYTTQFGGFYQFARLVAIMTEHYRAESGSNGDGTFIPHRIPGRQNDPIQNLVPVDFASRMVAEVVANPALHDRIYHLTDPRPPAWVDFKRWLEGYFHIYGGTFIDSDELANGCSEAESLLWEKYDLLMPRIHHHVQFDNANARQVMDHLGLAFPELNQPRFFKLLDYAASQRWGQQNGRGHNGNGRKSKARHATPVH